MAKTATLTLRVSEELKDKLARFAEQTNRTPSSVAEVAPLAIATAVSGEGSRAMTTKYAVASTNSTQKPTPNAISAASLSRPGQSRLEG